METTIMGYMGYGIWGIWGSDQIMIYLLPYSIIGYMDPQGKGSVHLGCRLLRAAVLVRG